MGVWASSSSGDSDDIKAPTSSPPVPSSSSHSAASSSVVGSLSDGSLADIIQVENGSASCNDQVEIEVVTPAPTDWTSHDRCPYYPPRSDGCTEPRSCRDCLNIHAGAPTVVW
ncbi:hypothetical protein GQ600_3239 [Phytophthora cactorum]|nr:hypothetical protein GQ600_3239 [Phytophthora cactorum]